MEEEENNEADYILEGHGEFPIVCLSAVEYCSDDDSSDYYDEDDDDEDLYDYDKDGRKRWRKTIKYKGDDRSKAIDWRKKFPNFDYDRFDEEQEALSKKDKIKTIQALPKDNVVDIFKKLFERQPGSYKHCAYVRNVAECNYYCRMLLESPMLPGVVGVDVEMENDRRPFREWSPKWRAIRAHSRMAKGMFARLLQAANCSGLVVIFDLYALARPHSWEGGIECDSKTNHWQQKRRSLNTSTLPPSLVDFILDPGIVRFGWALHCDWSSLYNSFGLLVPQKSYLDAQSPWRYDLKDRLHARGNGLADAASTLFDVRLEKSLRGYGHFWHGKPPYGKIPQHLQRYAAVDAQTSLDVAVQILIETEWHENRSQVWSSPNVQTRPMPMVRKRICAFFGKSDYVGSNLESANASTENDSGLQSMEDIDEDEETVVERCEVEEHSENVADENWSCETKGEKCYYLTFQETQDALVGESEQCTNFLDHQNQEIDQRQEIDIKQESINDKMEIVLQNGNRLVRFEDENEEQACPKKVQLCENTGQSKPELNEIDFEERPVVRRADIVWRQLPPSARQFIIASKLEALKTLKSFFQKKINKKLVSSSDWCPTFLVLRSIKHYVLKRIIFEILRRRKKTRFDFKLARIFCKSACRLLDYNLEWAWRMVFKKVEKAKEEKKNQSKRISPWKQCKEYQKSNLKKMNVLKNKYLGKVFSKSQEQKKSEEPKSEKALIRGIVQCSVEVEDIIL